MVATITSYVNITQGDLDALKQALASQGPISVSIDAGLKDFAYYSHGVFYNSECSKHEA